MAPSTSDGDIFRVVEHLVPCQYIREYPAATANDQEEDLYLCVKQYIPLDNPNPQPGDVTILGAHANGFPKVRRETLTPDWQSTYILTGLSGLGTLRTSVGGDTRAFESKWVSYPEYLDGRCRAPGTQ